MIVLLVFVMFYVPIYAALTFGIDMIPVFATVLAMCVAFGLTFLVAWLRLRGLGK